MRRHLTALSLAASFLVVASAGGAVRQQYAARQDGDIVVLEDSTARTTLSLIPSVGNVAFGMTVNGAQVLRFPSGSIEEFKRTPRLSGIPFMGPWANRLDEVGFYANGRHYVFNTELGNVRGPRPIHGFLSSTPRWRVVEVKADGTGAWVTSRLEFFREPSWMAQFPFAHTIDMTYRLRDGILEVATGIENLSTEPMPVAIGYHPYFQLTDSTRDQWTISVGARTEWLLSPEKLPTGETRPITQLFPDPARIPLRDFDLDHVFGDLVAGASGRAVMSVKGRAQQLDVLFGPKYRAAVIYAPAPRPGGPAQNFICFEPMAGITNALNLAHRGVYKELQSIPPGGTWQESFWVKPGGF
jgi:aldose 1-epimerase